MPAEFPNWLLSRLSDETKDKRIGADTYRMLCGKKSFFPSANIHMLFNAIRTGDPYPIKALLLFGNNGLVSFANTKKTYETLKSVEFLSAMDFYMTPTAAMADLILPASTWLEADEICQAPLIAGNYALVQQKVAQIGECNTE